MASSEATTQSTNTVQAMQTTDTSTAATTSSSSSDVYQFNIGLVFCDSAGKLSEADSWVVSTNADVVDFLVQWEADIMDENNATLDDQIAIMDQYTGKDDSGNLNVASTTYTQMSEESQDQNNTMSSEQTTLNNFGENAMSDMQSFNSMAATILQGLDYLKNLL